MAWEKGLIKLEDGSMADAQHPIIVSASRSTDLPAFYAEWFFARLKKGYSAWINPFNGKKSYIAYDKTRFIVFWSKNPRALLNYVDFLQDRNIGCYIQYTLNDYEKERLELGVPALEERIDTFKKLVAKLGKGHVIWRFDPLILTDKISVDDLLSKVDYIGNRLYGYTEKLVFSFVDIVAYRKVKSNLEKSNVKYCEWTANLMQEFAEKLLELNKKWGYTLATCAESIDLPGIEHNRCIDDELMIKLAYHDEVLMKFLGVEVKKKNDVQGNLFAFDDEDELPADAIIINDDYYAVKKKNNKDKGQRAYCGCIVSKDIGEYNTCPHLCEYCYANASKEIAVRNYAEHKKNPLGETITGR